MWAVCLLLFFFVYILNFFSQFVGIGCVIGVISFVIFYPDFKEIVNLPGPKPVCYPELLEAEIFRISIPYT
jgi:hypothetical protein